jgi:hypothetical protein
MEPISEKFGDESGNASREEPGGELGHFVHREKYEPIAAR